VFHSGYIPLAKLEAGQNPLLTFQPPAVRDRAQSLRDSLALLRTIRSRNFRVADPIVQTYVANGGKNTTQRHAGITRLLDETETQF